MIDHNEKMNLVFAIDDNYFLPFLVALKSILLNNISSNLIVHLFYKSLSRGNLNRLNHFERIHKIEVQRIFFSENLTKFSIDSGWPESNFIRLFVPYILKLDRYLYLDADIIITDDISKLYYLDLHDHPIAASIQPGYSEYRKKIGLKLKNENRYLMSGVLLVNVNKYKEKISIKMLFSELQRLIINGSLLPDMDTLNSIVANDFLELDEIYHSFNLDRNYENTPLVLHYAGSLKPWHFFYQGPYKSYYNVIRKEIPFFFKRLTINALKQYIHPKLPRAMVNLYRRMKR